MSRLPRAAGTDTGRSGFTLIELVIALFITAVITGTLFQLLQSQGRFVQMQSSREEVQQNSRASVELISSELRTASRFDPGLLEGEPDRVVFRSARLWGVFCGNNGANVFVRFPLLDGQAPLLTTSAVSGMVVRNESSGASAVIQPVTLNPAQAGAAASTCNGVMGASPGAVDVAFTGTVPGALDDGSPAYLFDQVTYNVQTRVDGGVARDWIFRSDAAGTMQPMAGPLEDDGLRFRYYRLDTEVFPGTDLAILRDLTRVSVRVATESRYAQTRQTQVDSTSVRLRN